MCFGQFHEKWVSVREKNIKLLLETVNYIAIIETVTCIITIVTVMCIMHLHNCNRDSHLPIITIKIVTHIFAVETVTCISAAET